MTAKELRARALAAARVARAAVSAVRAAALVARPAA
jgi:hypothetical protein